MKRPLMRRARTRRSRLRWLVGTLAIVAIAWFVGFLDFVADIPRDRADMPDNGGHYDAIVVLTGGSGRLEAGLALLEAGRAKKLFVSGVNRDVDVEALLDLGDAAPRYLKCCVVPGYQAGDTSGNAAETAAWMASEGYTSLLLVTANYHLSRSLVELRSALPDATIDAWPVFPPKVQVAQWWRWPGTAKLLAGEYTKYLAAMLRMKLRALRYGSSPDWSS